MWPPDILGSKGLYMCHIRRKPRILQPSGDSSVRAVPELLGMDPLLLWQAIFCHHARNLELGQLQLTAAQSKAPQSKPTSPKKTAKWSFRLSWFKLMVPKVWSKDCSFAVVASGVVTLGLVRILGSFRLRGCQGFRMLRAPHCRAGTVKIGMLCRILCKILCEVLLWDSGSPGFLGLGILGNRV